MATTGKPFPDETEIEKQDADKDLADGRKSGAHAGVPQTDDQLVRPTGTVPDDENEGMTDEIDPKNHRPPRKG